MDTDKTAHEEETIINEEIIDDGGEKKTFGNMTPDQVMSWFGRINKDQITKQFDEKVMPVLEELRAGRQVTDYEAPVSDLMYTDPEKFVATEIEKYEKKRKNTTETKLKQIDEAILGYVDDPLYREIHSDMKGIATKKAGEGWPPEAAVTFAKTEAEKNYYKRQISDDSDLEMLGGGGSPSRKKQKSLPPNLKELAPETFVTGYSRTKQSTLVI